MGKTKRSKNYSGCCLRNQKNHPHKKDFAKIKDIFAEEKTVNLLHKQDLPEPWDDKVISAVLEQPNKKLQIKFEEGFYNIFFNKTFVVNLTREELQFFPWTQFLPIESPPDLSCFRLV